MFVSYRSAPSPSRRGSDPVDATHIFDGLHPFPTQVCHMQLGKTPSPPLPWPPAPDADTAQAKDLFHLALGWLKEDKVLRKQHEKVTGRIRGPKPEVSPISFFHHTIGKRAFSLTPPRRPTQRPSLKSTITLIDPTTSPSLQPPSKTAIRTVAMRTQLHSISNRTNQLTHRCHQ